MKYNTLNFILISTDKAVRPTNIMGATKKLAEIILLSLSKKSKITKFSIVRFGNVLGSSGSVIPKFNAQINNGGPITLTHPNIKRFFMTISEAVQLVIETANLTNGGEVFILKMGKLIKIKILAEKLINLSGKTLKDKNNPNGDIEIKITGLLQGEKLYEEILTINNAKKTTHPKILKATEKSLNWDIVNQKLKELKTLMKKSDITGIKEMLVNLDIGYNSKK
jgi:FlaA1/EpsC-like NDP-sugar epimerase